MKKNKVLEELSELIERAREFVDCHYERPSFKKWQNDVEAFVARTYEDSEKREKLDKFRRISLMSAGWANYLTTYSADPNTTGLGEAVALLTSWRDDLEKRSLVDLGKIVKWISYLILGVCTAGGCSLIVRFVNNSNVAEIRDSNIETNSHNSEHNTTINNINVGEVGNLQIENNN